MFKFKYNEKDPIFFSAPAVIIMTQPADLAINRGYLHLQLIELLPISVPNPILPRTCSLQLNLYFPYAVQISVITDSYEKTLLLSLYIVLKVSF
ncbi:MAG: hypothetical protein EZS28_012798 [Streblomastix strix]|uniref:Uncharacterized protein n=1 Tax=Streblomastix strix TaxID=222440 RepID=A0A5J4W9X1_9EUKA|nr:MAG: hypothetical protein EZS28_012798 [Streblomastix strix]